jgi:GNAT superfamily N-acetyltransferase
VPDVTALLTAYDNQLRPAETENLPAGTSVDTDGPIRRVLGRHRGFIGAPVDLGLAGPAVDALIARQRDFFAARGEGVEWKTYGHDRPADLPGRLLAAGFVAEPAETVLIGSAAALAEGNPALPTGVALREVSEPVDLRRIAELATMVWAEDRGWLADELAARIANGAVVVAAEAGDLLVSSARLEFVPGTEFAGLWGGSTLAEWRGRGIYRALVAYRAQLAVTRGARYLQVDASEDSRPILQRLGFTAVTTTTPYVWTPTS